MAGVKRYFRLLDTTDFVKEKKGAQVITSARGRIEFCGVDFGYKKGESVLKGLDLKIKAGQTVALVGHSGAGKSTIASLIFRYYDPQKGKVLLDGNNLKDLTKESLRQQIGFVSQEAFVFNDTILGNLKFAKPDASMQEVEAACKIANIYDFIKNLSKGFKTKVGERGVRLSGGEKQRLSIARAVLENAPVLVFDEATSHLDSESEKLIQDALWKLTRNRTTVIIAHRLSTIKNVDEIFVLDKGKIVEKGSHRHLINKQSGIYKNFFEIQTKSMMENDWSVS